MTSPADSSGLERQSLLRLIGALGVAGMATGSDSLAHADALLRKTSMKSPAAGPQDFDFLMGQWQVTNRRLKQRFVGSDDWDLFPAESVCRRFLDSVANVDEIAIPSRGFSGLTVRLFNVGQQRWSLYWINSRTGELFPPVHGRFDGDQGEFFGDDNDDGKPVKVRFLWNKRKPKAPRWEQAFSLDGGNTWETNWIMEFTWIA